MSEIGQVNEACLAPRYEEADYLVMPWLAETVYLPLVEAIEVGVPIGVANRPHAREVNEGAAVYFDLLSPENLARAVIDTTAYGPERDRRIDERFRRAPFWSSSRLRRTGLGPTGGAVRHCGSVMSGRKGST